MLQKFVVVADRPFLQFRLPQAVFFKVLVSSNFPQKHEKSPKKYKKYLKSPEKYDIFGPQKPLKFKFEL